jgi:cytidylate kinase
MERKTSVERLAEVLQRTCFHEGPPQSGRRPLLIAISREAGANGSAVARAVGSRLGWPVYDRELIEYIAKEMGVRSKLLEGVDEKQHTWLHESLDSLFEIPRVSQVSYVRHLAETILSLAARGECVIVGRGAAQILPAETTVRVRLVSPIADRLRAIRDRFGISTEEAAAWIESTDQQRERFVKDHFQKDPTQACGYDLVLNSSRLTADECAGLIVEALHALEARAPVATTARPHGKRTPEEVGA